MTLRLATISCAISIFVGVQALAQANPVAPLSAAPTVKAPDKPVQNTSSQPLWTDLSAAEQAALRPLAASWDGMGVGQKRKWQVVAKDFSKMPAEQQAKLHASMAQWSALSPQQRAAARIIFAQNRELTEGLTPEQRKVQWEAYQQLSLEERRKLASNAPQASIAGAAPAIRPQPVLKNEPAPEFGTGKVLQQAQLQSPAPIPGKKIAVAPHVAKHGNILPGEPLLLKPNR